MVRGADAFLSQHLGDLGDARAWRAYLDALAHWKRLLGLEPRVVAHDLHPGYRTTAWVTALEGVERLGVQHHHAHVASCLADNGARGPVLGIAWDGTGYGPDGTVWGGEFLLADLDGFERVGHLEAVPMPGGEAAAREPWRMAGAMLQAAYGEVMGALDLDLVRRLDRAGWRHLRAAVARGVNAPRTSSAGRLFDAVASLLGVRDTVTFEGQAAMELEALAAGEGDRLYPVAVDDVEGRLVVRTTDVIRGVVEDLLAGVGPPLIAARFHATLAGAMARVAVRVRERTGIARTALSGGVFQNARLLGGAIDALEARGFEVLRHRQVPPNDGGLALGQAAIAARWLAGRAR
jgi:hydrogenase maturation protein HypF